MSKVTVSQQQGLTILHPTGEFVGGSETDELRTALDGLAREENTNLLIDLAGTTYLNSTALGVLIAAHTNFSKRGARIALCNVAKNIENIFVITKLTLVFTIYGTKDEAVAALAG